MKKGLLVFLYFSFINTVMACENIQYTWLDSIVVSPRSTQSTRIFNMPFRGKFDYVRVYANGSILGPFDVRGYLWYSGGYDKEIWFDVSRDNQYPGVVADTRLHPYDFIQQLYLELTNPTVMLRFYDVYAGKCYERP